MSLPCFCPVRPSQKFVHTRRLHFKWKCLKLCMFAYHHIKICIYICSYNRLPRLFNIWRCYFPFGRQNNLMGSGHFLSVSNFRYSNQTRINDIFEVKWMIWSTRTKRGSIMYLLSISSLSILRSQATHHV